MSTPALRFCRHTVGTVILLDRVGASAEQTLSIVEHYKQSLETTVLKLVKDLEQHDVGENFGRHKCNTSRQT